MKDMMSKLAGKAPEKDDSYDAKMNVLNELRDMAMGMMGDKVKEKLPGMKQVSVAAPDSSSLKKGLDVASKMLKGNGSPMDAAAMDVQHQHDKHRNEPSGDEGEPDQEMLNPHQDEDDMDMAPEEIDKMIAHLQAKRDAMRKSSY